MRQVTLVVKSKMKAYFRSARYALWVGEPFTVGSQIDVDYDVYIPVLGQIAVPPQRKLALCRLVLT